MFSTEKICEKAKLLFKEERAMKRLDGWFIAREAVCDSAEKFRELPVELRAAYELREMVDKLPLDVSDNAVFVGTQRDSFARTYALINPSFQVETFSGYCDPTAVFDDIEPDEKLTEERIKRVKKFTAETDYIKQLTAVYDEYENYTKEVAFFIEQVTGHVIPDFRPALKYGLKKIISDTKIRMENEKNPDKKINLQAMIISMEAVLELAHRYEEICRQKSLEKIGEEKEHFEYLSDVLSRVPENGCENLFEAIQAFMLLWQVMCLEQAPNPFAFSVGNADRIFEPFRAKEGLSREKASALLCHFLVFFNVGDRSWAISQNILVGGKSSDGFDLTNITTYALLDAYYGMNLPQPILSVKLHKNTPESLYRALGKFLFTPGCLTPSFFNDDALFETLSLNGVKKEHLEDYSVAGCQEPLIMGKDNGNTTNSWFNLPKILELTLNDGVSTLTGEKICDVEKAENSLELLKNVRKYFYKNAKEIAKKMSAAANGASVALSNLRVPFLSSFMGGLETGYDMRDPENQGTEYNGSGCLIHGLSVIADSFIAIDNFIGESPEKADELLEALRSNFENNSEIRNRLKSYPKYGNNIESVDLEAAEILGKISDIVALQKNYLGNKFRPDWSSPSTHLLYGYWVGATPDSRAAREMLGYGIDPLFGEATSGLGFRILSNFRLPFEKMNGGYASHFGVDPKFFRSPDMAEKGREFKKHITDPLFFNPMKEGVSPSYLYVNVTTPEILRKVLENPSKYAPDGVYIMRIHGTFVNFLDLSPAIQQDIIKRLDLESTRI